MAFVVDAAEWQFHGWTALDVQRAIESFLERVLTARERDEAVWVGDDFQTRCVLMERDLWSLRSSDSPLQLPEEIWQELVAWLGMAQRYADQPEWPEGLAEALAIAVGSEGETENADVAWAHHSVRAGRAVACLGLRREGRQETRSSLGTAAVWWVRTEEQCRAFWNEGIDIEGDSVAALERFAAHAFPDLYFHQAVWRGIAALAGGYAALSGQVRKYLTTLDAFGRWAFTSAPPALTPGAPVDPDAHAKPSNQIVERRFHGLGLNMAPEKPNVFADQRCRVPREVAVGNVTLYCEWHGKLEMHRNRVHVHPPVAESGNRVVIAAFHEHLPLPGG